jgi:hypothetical protein
MSILTILGTFLGGRVKDVVGGATADGNTLKKLEDRIIVLEQSAGNPLFVISGQVTGAVQNAIAVELRDDASNTLLQTVTTNGTGNYAFSGRIAGTYKIIPVLNGYTFTPATPVIALSGATTQDFTSSAAAGIPKAANLVAWWNLDEANGTRVNSINPGTHDLSVQGAPINTVAGKIGNGVTGLSASALGTPSSSAFTIVQDMSISQWVWIGTSGNATLFRAFNSGNFSNHYNINCLIGSNLIQFFADMGNVLFNYPGVTQGAWHHFVLTHKNSSKTVKLYVDGVLHGENTYTQTIPVVNTSFEIGSGSTGNSIFDETLFYNAELDAADVAALFNGGAGINP